MMLENKPHLYLVRHAESMQNVRQNLERDPSLSELGEKQAYQAGVNLKNLLGDKKLSAIIHTGLKRTIDTSKAILSGSGLDSPLIEMPEFREREMGIYDQMDFAELVRRNPYMEKIYHEYRGSCVWFFSGAPGEGVETLEEMKDRIIKGLIIVCDLYANQPVVLVAHAGSVKIIRMIYEEELVTDLANYLSSYVPKNCEIYHLDESTQD